VTVSITATLQSTSFAKPDLPGDATQNQAILNTQ